MSAVLRHTCRPVLILSLLAAVSACSDAPRSTAATSAPELATAAPAAAPATKEESVAELMRRANIAFREDRIVDPAGDNAVVLFLAVRDRDPRHPGLADALVELMPLAHFAFEAAVRNEDLAEAERLNGLIARINPESAITRSAETRVAELRATLAEAETERVATSAKAAAQASARLADAEASKPSAPASVAGQPSPQPARTAPAASAERAPAPAAPIATNAVPAVTASVAAITAPQPISKVAPDYPPQARSRKLEGFVELEFRVTANGSTEDIRVVRSEPEGLFDRSAVRALMRWKFKPAERNGVPEAATTRTTMNFRQS